MTRRLIIALVAAVSLTAAACSHAVSDAASQLRTGEATRYSGGAADSNPVGAIPDAMVRDSARNRDLLVNIEYPVRPAGPHPLILISPAFRLTNRDYVSLSAFWASRGYVVIRANHADLGEEETQAPADWRNRVRDLTFLMDAVPQLTQLYPELEGRIDATKVIVAGHGYGAFTAMLLGGAQTFPAGATYADPRVDGVIAIYPPGVSATLGLTADSWKTLAVPTLFITGGIDEPPATQAQTPALAGQAAVTDSGRGAFALSPAGDKWLLSLRGARYGTFSGRFDRGLDAIARERAEVPMPDRGMVRSEARLPAEEYRALRQQDVLNLGRGLSLAFMDTYIRSSAEARAALEGAGVRAGVGLERK